VKYVMEAANPLPVFHLEGVPWHEAPIPPHWHRCSAQTKGTINHFTEVERCACGAVRFDGYGRWIEKNQRRRV
jgi:hypothetical protein